MTRQWIEPAYSKSRIKTAGKRIRIASHDANDIAVLENHRASHAYIMNTFNVALRRRVKGKDIVVAQRLERRRTIFDKLQRESNMQLSTMHDIAGARVIFQNIPDLLNFRSDLHRAKVDHILRTKDDDRYNYIDYPKETGYRGIHDVYEYKVRSAQGAKWNGLLIEIQYRTKYQHAWETAVEVADLVSTNRIKFGQSDQYHKKFFQLASEIISRVHEDRNSCLPQLSNSILVEEFEHMDDKIGLISVFETLQMTQSVAPFRTNSILILSLEEKEDTLKVETYDSLSKAILRYETLEKELAGKADVVLVRSNTPEDIRNAFRNYYSDVNDFLKYIKDGCVNLKG